MARRPEQLMLALLGECVLERDVGPIPVGAFIDILEECGVAPGTTRATLQRMRSRGLFVSERVGREAAYSPTDNLLNVLAAASPRVLSPNPFDPNGTGWTMVAFTIPESYRAARHRLRAELTWSGFAALRDGLWISPGRASLPATVQELAKESGPSRVAAFYAEELPGFPSTAAVLAAWDVNAIRAAHDDFLTEWESAAPSDRPLPGIVELVADWLQLLRSDPRLPAHEIDPDWPAHRSVTTFRRLHSTLHPPAQERFHRLVAAHRDPATIAPA